MVYWVADVEASADDEDELSGVLWSLGTAGVEFVGDSADCGLLCFG